ncbi:MAG: hypothetical protein LAO04_03355 [Acidobacteriia bacterium]|nr:hypothetical protein [Terriglobia bacterium]
MKWPAAKIFLSEIIRTIDGPLAPLADTEELRRLVKRDRKHRALFSPDFSPQDGFFPAGGRAG